MVISNWKVYDLFESFAASKYPMSTDVSVVNDFYTPTIEKLAKCEKGTGHDQFLTGIRVNFDLTLTIKCWTEAERYRFLEFISSQSTMHKISSFELAGQYIEYVDPRIIEIMKELKDRYNETKDPEDYLRLLYSNPCGFKLTARMTTNYRSLKTIYSQRKTHRLPEWREFCKWIETLPFAELITDESYTYESAFNTCEYYCDNHRSCDNCPMSVIKCIPEWGDQCPDFIALREGKVPKGEYVINKDLTPEIIIDEAYRALKRQYLNGQN